ncbi:FAD-dependent pyridine nucleotide-disulfide oxidoreductase, partial [bacterium]|nr:FAD-dependent pyridine nucleotide-disulfide oxidoreductase [candidate division CSSED10-310 bacterium]
KMKLIADRKTMKLLGGQVVSGEPVADKVDLITMAIQYGIVVDELVYFSYSAHPYQSFFPANNLLVQAAENILKQV